jgi:hypothetical protein
MAQRFENIISTQSVGTGDIDKLVSSFDKLTESIDKVNKKSEQVKPPKWEQFAASAKQFIQDPLNAAGNAAEQFLLKLGPVGAGVSVAAAGLGILAKIGFDAERSLGALGDRIGDIGVRTGLTIKEVGDFSFAMKRAGGDISSVEGIMRKLSQGLADGSEEGKKSADGLRELGIATRTFNGDAAPMSDIILQVSGKLAGMTDTAQRNAAAIKIMGRSALEALPDLLELSDGVKRAKELGLSPNEGDVKRWDAYLKQVAEVDAQWEKLKRDFKEPLAAVISVSLSVGGKFTSLAQVPGLLVGSLFNSSPTAADSEYGETQGYGYGASESRTARRLALSRVSGIISGDKTAYGNTVSGAQYEADEAKRASEKLRQEYFALQGTGAVDAVNAKRKEWNEAEAASTRLAEKVKILAKEESERIAIQEKLRDLIRQGEGAYVIGTGPNAKIVTGSELAAANVRPLKTPGLYRGGEISPDLLLAQLQNNPSPDLAAGPQFRNGELTFVSPSASRTNPAAAGLLAAQGAGALDYAKQQQQIRLSGISGSSEYLGRLTELRGQSGQEKATAIEVSRIREAALQQELSITGDIVRYREGSLQNEIEKRLKIAEIEKQREESFKSLAVGFLDAGRSGGGAGLSRFVLGQANSLEDTVAGNAAKLIYPTIQKLTSSFHSGDPNSTVGKLLAGTPFGPDAAKTAIDVNTLVTRANSDATQALTNALAGLRGSALSPSGGGGGLPGLSGVSGLFSSSSPTDAEIAEAGITPDAITALNNVPEAGPNAGAGFSAASTVAVKNSLTLAKGVGIGAAAAAGAFGAYSGFKAGGAQGVSMGLGSLTGAAAGILSIAGVTGPAAPILAGVGLALGLVSSFIGDPKANREAEIGRHLKYNQYLAPEAINASMTTSGTYSDFDRFGGVRGSGFSPFPNVEQGFFDYRHDTTVPGRTTDYFGRTPVVVNVQAMDAKSIVDRHQEIGDAVVRAIDGHTGLQERIRNL